MIWYTLALAQQAGAPEPRAIDPASVPFPVYPTAVPPPPGVDGPAPSGSEPAPLSTAHVAAPPPVPVAAPSASTPAPTLPGSGPLKPGEQSVVVYLRGLPSGAKVSLQRGDDPSVPMIDPGIGALSAELTGPAARFLQLRLTLEDAQGQRYALYDGLVVLGGTERETLAFHYQDQQALRLPVSPSGRTELALDQRVPWWIAFGWGGIVTVWLATVTLAWALRGRAR